MKTKLSTTYYVEFLIEKAAEAKLATEAMQYAQAALNAANALLTLHEAKTRGA